MNNYFVDMQIEKQGLKVHCDECGYDICGVALDELESYVGHECSKCGANMLTRADYDTAVALTAFINDNANSLEEKLARWGADTKPGKRHIAIRDINSGAELVRIDC